MPGELTELKESLPAEPTAEEVDEALLVVGVIRGCPGITARQISRQLAAGGVRVRERRVRELVWIARRWVGEPILAKAGRGYRIASSVGEALAYADDSRRMGRNLMALAERVSRTAMARFGGQPFLPGQAESA